MLRYVRMSVCLSLPFSDSLPSFARWRRADVAVSHAFDRRQHGRLCPHPNAMSGGRGLRREILVIGGKLGGLASKIASIIVHSLTCV